MAFKSPIVSPLTDGQEQLLSQLGSLKNIITVPTRKSLNIPDDKQISSFDYMLRLAESTVGVGFLDLILKKFIEQIFNTENGVLEKIIINSLAKSLDKNGKHISSDPDESNKEWLDNNIKEELTTVFKVVKVIIVKQIIAMIFGPKEKMKPSNVSSPGVQLPTPPTVDIKHVLAADSMFSLSNADSNQFGDVEYNLVKLKERLETGQVIFTISCQDVKISLPQTFDSDLDKIASDIVSIQNNQSISGTQPIPNPAQGFDYITNHVGKETQKINSQQNVSAIKKSFLQILVEKIINLLTIAVKPYLQFIFDKINLQATNLNLNIDEFIPSPEELKTLAADPNNKELFNKRQEFIKNKLNSLYAMLLAMVLKALIREVKKLIKNALAKKAAVKAQSKLKRLRSIQEKANDGLEKAEKVKQSVLAFNKLKPILNYS